MGDAKKRGTFDQRQAAAIEREQERLRNLPPYPRTSAKTLALMAGIAGIVARSTLHPKAISQQEAPHADR